MSELLVNPMVGHADEATLSSQSLGEHPKLSLAPAATSAKDETNTTE